MPLTFCLIINYINGQLFESMFAFDTVVSDFATSK
jgi:hypothetical protein